MRLIADWIEFHSKLEEYIAQAGIIHLSYKRLDSQEDLDSLESKFTNWKEQVVVYLKSAFDDQNNEFAHGIQFPQYSRPVIGIRTTKPTEQLVKERLEDLQYLADQLSYYLKILGISEAIVNPDKIILEQRKKYSTDDVLELLMHKLYELYDESYYPVVTILRCNGIELGRHGEERELVEILERYGYVEPVYLQSPTARLTLEGKRYVENSLKKTSTDYGKIPSSSEEVGEKFDEIIAWLKRHRNGQEIIFDELEELKNLYTELKRKNWGELLKGKLRELAIEQAVNEDVVKYIFEQLTDQILRLR